jgi:hypothetical protein
MLCPLCRQRRAKRSCPALHQQICAVCCGTKRLVEIRCPTDCGYLKSAHSHPPAPVQRQRERDLSVLVPTLSGLTERQAELFFVLGTFLSSYRPDGFQRLVDLDVADGAAALAATYETSIKGVIYEHRASSLPAQRLAADLRVFLTDIGQRAGSAFERDAAAALRRLEKGAREASGSSGAADRTYLDRLGRLMRQAGAEPEKPAASSPIITGS